MTTKTELFAELNDKENRVNATAHIAVYKDGNGNTSVIVRQHSAPNIWLSNHKSDTTTAAAVAKYTAWLNEWVAAQAEAAQARADLLAEIEADHAEGEAVVAAINNDIAAGIAHAAALEEDRQRQIEADRAAGRPVDEEGNDTREWCGSDIQAAHAEALVMNSAHTLAKQTGFTVEVCAAELEAEEGDYFAALARLRTTAAKDAGLNEEWVAKVAAGEVSLAEALGDMDTDAECAAMEVSPAMHRYLLWLGRAKENGLKLVAWNCPACNVQLQGVYPSNDREEWDSHTMCPACNHLYFKITRYGENGAGSVELIEV